MKRKENELKQLRNQLRRMTILELILFVDMTSNQEYEMKMETIQEVTREIESRIQKGE